MHFCSCLVFRACSSINIFIALITKCSRDGSHRYIRFSTIRKYGFISYQNGFHFLETSDLLDPLNGLHLFLLHHVFIPRINRALKEFNLSGNTTVFLFEQNIAISQNNCSILHIFVVMWNPFTTHPLSIPLFMGWRKMDLLFRTQTVIMQ